MIPNSMVWFGSSFEPPPPTTTNHGTNRHKDARYRILKIDLAFFSVMVTQSIYLVCTALNHSHFNLSV